MEAAGECALGASVSFGRELDAAIAEYVRGAAAEFG